MCAGKKKTGSILDREEEKTDGKKKEFKKEKKLSGKTAP